MDEGVEQQLLQRFQELPLEVQQAIQAGDLPGRIQAIGQKYQLHIDQVGALEDEVMLVMLGFSDPGDFAQNLIEHVHVASEVTAPITQEVSRQIFMPIRESMKTFMSASETPKTPSIQPVKELPTRADIMLQQKTVTPPIPAPTPSAPAITKSYGNDPYREPTQ